jgi:hypothetical protein
MSNENPQKIQPSSAGKPAGEPSYRTLKPVGSQPVPAPGANKPPSANAKPRPKAEPEAKETAHPDPTRFGDWEVKGRCIDF